jgi:hypothetical protein
MGRLEWRETLIEDGSDWFFVGQLVDSTQVSVSKNQGCSHLNHGYGAHFSTFFPTGIAAIVVCYGLSHVCHV